ncbi:DNA helicase MCM9 isoform X2 [Seriola aureovittata]|uniref:DNA helicase MCM9 isoform X2 n=1 Tax=Seriola aureovittata TaxID=2871759 RepID=UPI0024BE7BA3|nr:DNA helicase MCM9 isoform X2 [Seriola aureovittata]
MSINSEQEALIGRVFEAYLAEHHHGDILQLIEDTNEESHQPVVVNAMTLFEASMEVGDYFNAYPNDVLVIFDKVLHRTAMELSQTASPGAQTTKEQKMRYTLHARITGLPVCPELTRDTVPRSRDVGHFLSVTGTVIRTSVAKVLEYERDYMCAKCRHVFTMQADFDQFYTFVQPVACPNPDACNSYKFSCLSGGSEPAACRDYQEIKIQEQVQRLSVGSIPRSMVVVLEDDLVDSCKSGDDVTVYGVMCQRWKPFYDGTRCDVELVLKANNIEVNNQQVAAALLMKDLQQEFEDFWESYKHDPIAGRNQVLLSLCPQVFGMYVIKLAVAMVLAGGVQRIDSSGSKIRGECHMLLVGDPGTGKSQFLKYAAKIMPRSVLTAGIGSTSAGLTVAAVKDGGDWHLEAGALVLSDGGLCCIDEFNSIKEHDRISIHEAMEQQSISVAKAGMVCKLNTRSTILAATNPKGQYNPNEPLSVNVALASPLLSRFDLVLVLLDTRNAEWDRVISSFILEDRGMPADSSSLWSMEKMKGYFSVIKRLQPQVSEDANSILSRYYQLQRKSDGRNAARTTIRMLESLSRLAEAHARLMYRETVTVEDAVIAVSVMECSMQGGALLGNVNALLTSFPAEPGQQYQTQCQVLLEGLNLPLLLQREMDRLARLKSSTSDASQFDPAADNHQHRLRDAYTINKTHHHDITSDHKGDVTVESGLDWFHSITPSVSPDHMTSPTITSTQEKLNRKAVKHPHGQSDVQSNTDSSPDQDGAVSSAAGGLTHSDTHTDDQHVVQKVSKSLRDRRLGDLDPNHQLCDTEGEGGHGERVGLTNSAGKNVTDALNSTSDSHSSSTLSSAEHNRIQDNQSSGKNRRDQTGTKNMCSVLREKMEAELQTGKNLHAKLSGFKFKPRKMRPLLSSELQTERGGDESASPPTDTEKNQKQNLLQGASRRKHVSCVGDGQIEDGSCLTSIQLDEDDFSFGKDKVARGKAVGKVQRSHDTDALTADKTVADSSAGTPPSNSKSFVGFSTLAKLSRFSFTCTTESTTTNHPPGVRKGSSKGNSPECSRANSDVKKTQNSPQQAPSEGKMKPVVTTGKVKDVLPPPVSGLPPGQEPERVLGSQSKTKTEPTHTAHSLINNGPVDSDSSFNLKKRKCFELAPPPSASGSKGPFSGLSLFGSVELGDDVLDTDWDQEVSKKVRV